ncbi:MAG: hypothetical protein HQ503_12215, partial [Rhodospirillales bacterium]|nr:hypothetical protein [Rhodospirillales bacterium]
MALAGTEFLSGMLSVVAVVLLAAGLFLIFLDLGPPAPADGLRGRLSRAWVQIGGLGWAKLPPVLIKQLIGGVEGYVSIWFTQSEQNTASGGVFLVLVILIIPVAALANALLGGSPILIWVIALAFAGYAALTILGEIRLAAGVRWVLSVILFSVIFFFVPGYVFVSLTERVLHMPIGHALLGSFLIVPLLYFVAQFSVLVSALGARDMPAGALKTILNDHYPNFAAALPVAYVLVFAALLAGHLSAEETALPMTWRMLLVALAGVGAATNVPMAMLKQVISNRPTNAARLGWLGVGIGAIALITLIL